MTGSRIDRVWLMNSVNWPIRALFIREVVNKTLKKEKNHILYIRSGHMGETHSKRIALMIGGFDSNPTKICFYESCMSAKITQNLTTKPMSEVITKLSRVHIDPREPSPDIVKFI